MENVFIMRINVLYQNPNVFDVLIQMNGIKQENVHYVQRIVNIVLIINV